jgi:N-methylhydantoinase B
MSNTLNTPIEALELELPIRVRRYAIRRGSGGEGQHRGGDGLVREIEFLTEAHATILSDRRVRGPYGLAGGEPGQPGANSLLPADGSPAQTLPGKASFDVQPGDVLRIETPGGGGWGAAEEDD